MLSALQIENIAVVEQAEISFHPGFNVLSGETGAGKSIIIDAIGAILGERTYREVIRTGADRAYVCGIFTGVPRLPWFEDNLVPYEEELQIQRAIQTDGKNLCKVNGQTVSVGTLRALGRQLMTIHGQHDSQQLFDEQTHLELLDRFSGVDPGTGTYHDAYEQVMALRKELARLSLDENEKLRRQEMLTYQINELEKAALKPGEDLELENRQKLLMNSEKLVSGLEKALAFLQGDEDSSGAADQLSEAERALGVLGRLDDSLIPQGEKVRQLYYAVQDAAEELRDYRDSLSYSEEELEALGERLDLLHRLKRKYGGSCEEMLAYLEQAKAELDDIVFSEEKTAQLEKQLKAATATAEAEAGKLRERRISGAAKLEAAVCKELADLNMPRVQFLCEFSETELTPLGIDQVRFLMSANVGEATRPLAKVASGGELARIMLALKNVLAAQDTVGTMIFDEVDAGVSGRAAQKVAEKLLSVSRGRQVLCVTHLPQIAALAENHLLISKSERQGRTYTAVQTLDREGRTRELARMIGGAEITENTLRSAAEMLRFDR